VSATLKMTRESVLVELRRGPFEILVDGKNVGSIKHGETVETAIEPGSHILRVRAGRYSSRDHAFDAADDAVVSFRCNGAIIWPLYLASLVKPDLGLWLKRE
jgi:hypothetical protein